jgi:hypothetical protein
VHSFFKYRSKISSICCGDILWGSRSKYEDAQLSLFRNGQENFFKKEFNFRGLLVVCDSHNLSAATFIESSIQALNPAAL